MSGTPGTLEPIPGKKCPLTSLISFRKYLCWLHIFTALVCLRLSVALIATSASARHFSARVAIFAVVLLVFAFVFGAAWLTSIKAKATERAWGIAASSLYIVTTFLPALLAHRFVAGNSLLFGLGVVGFAAFGKRLKAPLAAKIEEHLAIPGDFTNRHLNRVAQGVTFGLSLGAYMWWTGWLKTQHVALLDNGWVRCALTMVVLLAMTSIHESGHAIAGLAGGMKLRAFFIGPLQWRASEGRWRFEFKPMGLFLVNGVTALVPGEGELSARQYLTMMAAGPLINVITGGIALFVALNPATHLSILPVATLALFGAWSFGLAAANLLPFCTPQGYSDGAIVLQLIAGGAFADFHISVARIGSSLVSPLRPRDYDIGSIQRTARNIAKGRQALLLWLYAFSHSLDCGKHGEADEVLAKAELVCLQTVPNIPAELHTTFVFGNALIRRDRVAARFWWNRMQAKNPKQFNADYWRAESALHWIEGNLAEARSAWQKSHTLAAQLPKAGAYDFSRHCCNLLQRELEEAEAA